jgi:hypothetical protein
VAKLLYGALSVPDGVTPDGGTYDLSTKIVSAALVGDPDARTGAVLNQKL